MRDPEELRQANGTNPGRRITLPSLAHHLLRSASTLRAIILQQTFELGLFRVA